MYTHTVNTCHSANVTTLKCANETNCLPYGAKCRGRLKLGIKWLESKDVGKINHVNVKHVRRKRGHREAKYATLYCFRPFKRTCCSCFRAKERTRNRK